MIIFMIVFPFYYFGNRLRVDDPDFDILKSDDLQEER